MVGGRYARGMGAACAPGRFDTLLRSLCHLMNAVLGNEGERTLALQCMADGLPRFWQNYRFHAKRKFEIDLAWPDQKVGIEIDGGIFNGKAHGSVTGILRDL